MATAHIAYDDVTASLIPSTAEYVFYYTDGRYANFSAVKAQCPSAEYIPIAVTASDNATVLDVETGDATIAQIYSWLKAQWARVPGWSGQITKAPVIYIQASNVDTMVRTMNANKFVHGKDYVIWSAHYGAGEHVCASNTCGSTSTQCDGTQFTDVASGKSLDESELLASFFASSTPPKPGIPTNGKTIDITSTTAVITYTGVSGGVKYDIQVTEGGTATGKQVFRESVGGSSGSGVKVTGLSASTKYGWRIAAYNSAGVSGGWSGFIPFTTAADANTWTYPAPAGVGIGQGTATIPVSWKAVSYSGKAPASYTLEILDNAGKVFQTFGSVTGTSQTVTIPRGTYTARVWANGSPVGSPHTDYKFTV